MLGVKPIFLIFRFGETQEGRLDIHAHCKRRETRCCDGGLAETDGGYIRLSRPDVFGAAGEVCFIELKADAC